MRRIDFYSIKRGDNLGDPETWNKRFEDIDLRLAASEDAMKVVDDVADRAEKAALSRINDVVTPLATEALQRLTNVATIFEATSDTEVTLGEGTRQFIIPQGQRATFVPLAYLVFFPPGDLDNYLIGRTTSFDRANGVLLVEVVRFLGEGSFSDWQIAPIAFVSELDALAAAAAASAMATAADRTAVAADKTTTVNAKNDAVSAKDTAVSAKNDAQAALLSFLTVYRGAVASDPADGEQGHFYFNTSQQMAKVYTATGWSPLFSLSLGGIRQGELTATAGQTVFNVGSFTFMNVWLNGVKLIAGIDFTLASPNVTLTEAAAAGDDFSYLGYYSTDITDFYSKEAADERFYNKDEIDAGFYTKTAADARYMSATAIVVPVGACIDFPATAPPAGFLKRNGALLSRTTYAALWAYAQASGNIVSEASWAANTGAFSTGDGSTNFRIPDGRGVFTRGWDDGRGLDSGRAIGSYQADDLKAHTHGYSDAKGQGGGATNGGEGGPTFGGNTDVGRTTGSTGGAETRPKNVALLACIKY